MRSVSFALFCAALAPTAAAADSFLVDGFTSDRPDCVGGFVDSNSYKIARRLLTNAGHTIGDGWSRLEPATLTDSTSCFLARPSTTIRSMKRKSA